MINDNTHSPRWLNCDLDCDLCDEMQNCPLINPDKQVPRSKTPKHGGFRKRGKEQRKEKEAKRKDKRKG